jgi:hypothetical protein
MEDIEVSAKHLKWNAYDGFNVAHEVVKIDKSQFSLEMCVFAQMSSGMTANK